MAAPFAIAPLYIVLRHVRSPERNLTLTSRMIRFALVEASRRSFGLVTAALDPAARGAGAGWRRRVAGCQLPLDSRLAR